MQQLIYISMQLVTLSSFFKSFRLKIIYSFFIILTKLITKQYRNSIVDCCYKYVSILIRSCWTYILFNNKFKKVNFLLIKFVFF